MDSRAAFEAWAKEYGMLLAHDKADVALTWAAWQASRLAALEEAAKVCERASLASKRDGYGTESAAEQGCADAIRTLAQGGAA